MTLIIKIVLNMIMILSSLPSILISPVKTHHMSRAICGGEDTMTGKVLSMASLLCICVGRGQLYRLCRWVRIGRKGKRMMTKIIWVADILFCCACMVTKVSSTSIKAGSHMISRILIPIMLSFMSRINRMASSVLNRDSPVKIIIFNTAIIEQCDCSLWLS